MIFLVSKVYLKSGCQLFTENTAFYNKDRSRFLQNVDNHFPITQCQNQDKHNLNINLQKTCLQMQAHIKNTPANSFYIRRKQQNLLHNFCFIFHKRCPLHNFIIFCSNNTHIFHKPSATISIPTRSFKRAKILWKSQMSFCHANRITRKCYWYCCSVCSRHLTSHLTGCSLFSFLTVKTEYYVHKGNKFVKQQSLV